MVTTGAAVRVSDSPAPKGSRRNNPAAKVEVEEIDALSSSLGATNIG